LDASVEKLSQLASGITADATTGSTGTAGASVPADSAPVFGNTSNNPQGEVTPIAGESGATDAPTEVTTSGEVVSEDADNSMTPVGTTPETGDQPQPGSTTLNDADEGESPDEDDEFEDDEDTSEDEEDQPR
jgi:hypothetical protein